MVFNSLGIREGRVKKLGQRHQYADPDGKVSPVMQVTVFDTSSHEDFTAWAYGDFLKVQPGQLVKTIKSKNLLTGIESNIITDNLGY